MKISVWPGRDSGCKDLLEGKEQRFSAHRNDDGSA